MLVTYNNGLALRKIMLYMLLLWVSYSLWAASGSRCILTGVQWHAMLFINMLHTDYFFRS